MNIKFMKHQVKNEIARSGQEYQFKRKKENKYHQNVGEEDIAIVKGIYHETNGYISLLRQMRQWCKVKRFLQYLL